MIELRPGDVFLTTNSRVLNAPILFFQKLWSKDGKATYGHAGVVIDERGTTFESLWKVRSRNIYDACKGRPVFIARHVNMNPTTCKNIYNRLEKEYGGDHYPIYRLLFHIFPPASRIATNKVVCSELVAKFMLYSGIGMGYYNGVNPDDLHDFFRVAKDWKIIFEGALPTKRRSKLLRRH